MKLLKSRFISSILILATVLFMSGVWQLQNAYALGLTAISDTMSREKVGTLSSHTIKFRSTSAIGVGTAGVTLSFPATTATTFTIVTPVVGDIVGICHGPSTGLENGYSANCTANNETLSAGASGANQWGFTTSGTNPVLVVLAAPSSTFTNTIAANDYVTIFISNAHFTNPASVASPVISITTTSDSGNFSVSIIDSDQVSVTATVNSSLTFDIDTGLTHVENGPTYTVALGAITTAAVVGSNGSSINSIWVNLDTNATGGAAISVTSANAALKSVVNTGHTIPSASGTMANATANYGICVNNVAGLTEVAPFASTCTHTPVGNVVGGLLTTAQNIFTVPGVIAGASGEIIVDAENGVATVAHPDYADTLTLIATGMF